MLESENKNRAEDMKEHKKNENNRIMIKYKSLLLVCVCLCFFSFGCGKQIVAPTYDDEVEPSEEVAMFAIVTNLDEINGKITLRAVNYATEITLSYNGGVDVRDKYGDILSMTQVELGSVVDVVYDSNRDKLVSLHMSDNEKVQKLEGISGAVVDKVEKTVQINGSTYRMKDNTSAFSDNNEIGVDEICSEDQITVWLYNDIICSMYVELGHGYVRLADYDSYLGGMVEIGYDVIVPVTEDMLLTVREGEYTLRISKDNDVGTKKVKVIKNQEVDVSLADIAIEPKQMGSVLFKVTPGNAAVYIDKVRVNTEGAIKLEYGKHNIYITADGYDSYSASFNVNYPYKIKEYTLKETGASSEENQPSTTTEQKTSTGTTASETTTDGTTVSGTTESKTTTEEATTQSSTTKTPSTDTGTKTNNKVIISSPVGASVYFDGEYIGIAPISFTKVTGSHIITFSMTGYLSKSYTVTFTDDGKDSNLKYDNLISLSSLIE